MYVLGPDLKKKITGLVCYIIHIDLHHIWTHICWLMQRLWFFYGELVSLPFQGPASLNGCVVYEKYCNNGGELSLQLSWPIKSLNVCTLSTDTRYINPWLKNCRTIPLPDLGRKFENEFLYFFFTSAPDGSFLPLLCLRRE